MAPVYRRGHRQQRVRGAGASTVQASFGFDFGAPDVTQASLPPQRSGRRSQTPVQSTPCNLDGSAGRPPSFSATRTVKSRLNATPKNNVVTPQPGKRKRGSSAAAAPPDKGEDELSLDRVENVVTVEKSKKPARTISPIRKEANKAPDELFDEASPAPRSTPGNVTGLLSNDTEASADRRRDGSRESNSVVVVAVTSGMQPNSSPRQSSAAVEEDTSASDEESGIYEESEPEEPLREPIPHLDAKRTTSKSIGHTRLTTDGPKRGEVLRPKLAISVMRMKGHGIWGITVADTTRTILGEIIDHRLSGMLEEMQKLSDPSRKKEMRSEVKVTSSFKESLDEKLLDLQDANDVLAANLKKKKTFRRDNAELRREILALQKSRQEVALEHDDVQADFESEKARFEFKKTLSNNLFDIEAAIKNGRKRAEQERREDEGPDVPLGMLLKTVGRDVGSIGGGLLADVKDFNITLEKAAGWLERRT